MIFNVFITFLTLLNPILTNSANPSNFSSLSDLNFFDEILQNFFYHEKVADTSSNEMVPFKTLFVIDPQMKPDHKSILERIFPRINERIGKMIKGPYLTEIRFHRIGYDKKTQKCSPPQANNRLIIPGEFALPCCNHQGLLIPEKDVPQKPTQKIQDLIEEKYNLVVYVGVYNDTVPMDRGCKVNAWAGVFRRDPVTHRPTHGGMLICWTDLTKVDERTVENLVVHELMHIIGVNYDQGKYKKINQTWTKKNGQQINQSISLSMLPSVVQAARDYFNCPTLEAAPATGAHLGQHQFEQEVMARVFSHSRISALTLGAAKETGWYEVDVSMAEPMTFGQSIVPRCDVNHKGCHQIVREALQSNDSQAMLVHPYCVPGKSPLCSIDGRTRLMCFEGKDCPILVMDHGECDLSTNITNKADLAVGSRMGNGTMCLSFIRFVAWKGNGSKVSPLCVEFECQKEKRQILYKLHPGNESCEFHCNADDSNKVSQKIFEEPCNSLLGGEISFWCPDYGNICGNRKFGQND